LAKREKKRIQEEMKTVEEKMDSYFEKFPTQISLDEAKSQISVLLARKDDILRLEEQSWLLKSRAIWLKSGERDTKIFHKFAEGRRKTNTIWDIQSVNGDTLSS